MLRRYWIAPLAAICLLLSASLSANMIPIPRYNVVATDQYCQNKKTGEQCTMPADAFGGRETT